MEESAEHYGLDPKRFKILDDPKPAAPSHLPPPTDGLSNLNRGSVPATFQNQPDFVDANEYRGIPVYRLSPSQPSGQAAINSAAQSTAKPIADTSAAGVVGKALPGTVNNGKVSAATLSNVADGSTRFAREASHSSYVPTSNPLSATDAGSSATISISAFTMQVAGVSVSLGGGSIAALSYSTLYYIYYSDATVSGGSVSYSASLTKSTALDTTSNFYVGSITTPAATNPNTVGNNDGGVGGQVGAIANSYAWATAAVTGGGFPNATFAGGSGSVNSSTPILVQSWTPFVPAVNDAAAISRVISVHYAFTLASVTANFTLSWSANTGSGTIASGSTTSNGTATLTLPVGTDLTTLNIEATNNWSTGAGHASLVVSAIRVIETS